LDRADDGNDSNPDLTVTNLDSAREASKVQEDSEQEVQRIEPGEPEESSTVMAAETEAGTLSDKIDDIPSQEEDVTIQNIEETIEKEKKEGSEDIDVTKVKRAVMEEVIVEMTLNNGFFLLISFTNVIGCISKKATLMTL
jgi:hypothetical protein